MFADVYHTADFMKAEKLLRQLHQIMICRNFIFFIVVMVFTKKCLYAYEGKVTTNNTYLESLNNEKNHKA